jgi:uncharacterized protein (DUF302 family)
MMEKNLPIGIKVVQSPHTVNKTINLIQKFLEEHGATIYARINQQEEVEKTGQQLQSLEFIMFGNPKTGGPVMTENILAALDLPLKIISWEDDQNKVWIAYNEASYLQERYSLSTTGSSALNLDNLISTALG